jgi:hypothetical protein
MNKLAAVLCCVMLASPSIALAQDPAAKRKPPVSSGDLADKKRGVSQKLGDCTKAANGKGLQAGNPAFDRHMSECLKG